MTAPDVVAVELDPPAGSFGLSRISGPVGWFVWLGQLLSGDGSRWTHAWLVLDNDEIIEAQPGGAKIQHIAERYGHKSIVVCDKPVQNAVADWVDEQLRNDVVITKREVAVYEADLRTQIVKAARRLDGVPYAFRCYPALGLLALGVKPKRLRRWVKGSGYMICSMLVDFSYFINGMHLFNDGRESMDVTPGDLFRYSNDDFIFVL